MAISCWFESSLAHQNKRSPAGAFLFWLSQFPNRARDCSAQRSAQRGAVFKHRGPHARAACGEWQSRAGSSPVLRTKIKEAPLGLFYFGSVSFRTVHEIAPRSVARSAERFSSTGVPTREQRVGNGN